MRAKNQVRLSLYERGIAQSLEDRYGYTAADARELVVDYIAVVRKLAGYEQPAHYADLLHRARRMDQSPAKWLSHIQEVDKGEMIDTGIEAEDGSFYTNTFIGERRTSSLENECK